MPELYNPKLTKMTFIFKQKKKKLFFLLAPNYNTKIQYELFKEI